MTPSIGRIVHVKGYKRRTDGANLDAAIVTGVTNVDGPVTFRVDLTIFPKGGNPMAVENVPFFEDITAARAHPGYDGTVNGINGLVAFWPTKV